jgi:hypothetical protein
MPPLGWRGLGLGPGSRLAKIDMTTGTVEVLGDDGQWVVQTPRADS